MATPLPTVTASAFDIESITQICIRWGGRTPEGAIDCADAIQAALDSFGERATLVDVARFDFAVECPTRASCLPRSPDHAWVAVRSSGKGLLVALAIGPDGVLLVWPPVAYDLGAPPPFDAPSVATPVIVGPVPAEVESRAPLPLCGVEASSMGGPYDAGARRCFLAGVLAGRPVEFVQQTFGTEGEAVTAIYRFVGHGAVIRYERDGERWTRSACGISPLDTEVIFQLGGICVHAEL